MIFMSAQPDEHQFYWQLDVQVNNFTRLGIDPRNIVVLIGYRGSAPSRHLVEFAARHPEVRVNAIQDTRVFPNVAKGSPSYIYAPSIRPHIIAKFLRKYPEMQSENVFYHDADIIFREVPRFDALCQDDTVYVSDTRSYISPEYCKSKGEDLFQHMCRIVDVEQKLVEDNSMHAGGAQYLFKGMTPEFWDKIEADCQKLFRYLSESVPFLSKRFNMTKTPEDIATDQRIGSPREYHPIQAWCSDMWAVLWNLLRDGKTVRIHDELNFCWPMAPIREWHRTKIMHNAGVEAKDKNKLFHKGSYIDCTPFSADLTGLSQDYVSWLYTQEILLTKAAHESIPSTGDSAVNSVL